MKHIVNVLAAFLLLTASAAAAEPSQAEWTALDRRLAALAAADQFSGTVAVMRGDRVVFRAAHGIAERSFNVPVTIGTRFNIGSIGKTFTATVVCALVERGLLRFDDTIDRYLDETWLPRDISSRVTVSQLLSHTSGLGSFFQSRAFTSAPRNSFVLVDDFKPAIREERLAFEPGTRWSYSNTGFLLLSAIVERVTRTSFDEAVATYVTGPAGMTGTGAFARDAVVPNLARGYTRLAAPTPGLPGSWRATDFLVGYRGTAAGGTYSTAEDLARFGSAFLGGRLVNDQIRAAMTSPKPASPDYGYGLVLNEEVPGSISHGGGAPGWSAWMLVLPESGYSLAVLSNLDGDGVELAMRETLGVLGFSRPPQATDRPADPSQR